MYIFVLVKDIDSSRYPDAAVIASFSRKLGPERFSFVAEEVLPCFIMESGQPHSYHHVSIIYGNIADAEIYRGDNPKIFFPLPVFVCDVSHVMFGFKQ